MPLNESFESFFNRAQVTIDNALQLPKIQNYLQEYGYTLEKLRQGKVLYETAFKLQQQQRREYGEQIAATETLNKLWETAQASYMKCVKIARVAFKNNAGIATELDLNGIRKRTISGWLLQVQQFYNNALANPQILASLAEYGITEEKLKFCLAEVEAVAQANLVQEKEKGDAQNATKTRDKAVDELDDWLSDFIAIAKIALEAEPQLLESLGILERS
jgi:hypothetical protein